MVGLDIKEASSYQYRKKKQPELADTAQDVSTRVILRNHASNQQDNQFHHINPQQSIHSPSANKNNNRNGQTTGAIIALRTQSLPNNGG